MAATKKASKTKAGASKKTPAKKKRKNQLDKVEKLTAAELDRRRTRAVPARGRKRKVKKSKGAKVPKNRTAAEIKLMPDDDPAFKHPQGAKRKYPEPGEDTSHLSIREIERAEKQESANRKRAKARKADAVAAATAHEEGMDERHSGSAGWAEDPVTGERVQMFDEDVLIADGKLSLDDWDEEELIRGYRRDRSGRFADPPKFIPREVQQEAFRRLMRIGERRLRQSYVKAIDQLVELALDEDTPAKVKLEAIKEIQNRTVGKTPDVVVQTEAPWRDMLVDSVIPIDEAGALDVRGSIKSFPALPASDDLSSDDGGDPASFAATATPAQGDPPSSDGRTTKDSGSTNGSKKKGRAKAAKASEGTKTMPLEADWEDDD